ncbi:MAG TPA: hypothetical protein DCR43_07950 [Bacteroidales bacterium]|nr:MAG: hypothetical protein A2X11_14280 [Bacteroidetes bacterium GWE2_42_24]OFY31522.1 MAG: hypothetical protein A2X09_08015 [Bacteroidetes bacterium GWF2_43_11]HAQ65766.1 hypothetical protein [Bacteroidales bacterium]HBZ67228.1 hypothetical protein [Bacteroidales bacterium]
MPALLLVSANQAELSIQGLKDKDFITGSNDTSGDLIVIGTPSIKTSSQRVMPPKKEKSHDVQAIRMPRTLFTLCPQSGRPIACGIGSADENFSKAIIAQLNLIAQVFKQRLILADK